MWTFDIVFIVGMKKLLKKAIKLLVISDILTLMSHHSNNDVATHLELLSVDICQTTLLFTWTHFCVNSLAPGRFKWNFRLAIFNQILGIHVWDISCEIAPWRFSLDLTYLKSTLVQVMAWCHQATSHYLNQCWPRSMSPYGVTMPQWVNTYRPRQNGHHFTDDTFKQWWLDH